MTLNYNFFVYQLNHIREYIKTYISSWSTSMCFEFATAYSYVQNKTDWGLALCVNVCKNACTFVLEVKCKIVYPQKNKTVGKLNLNLCSLKRRQNFVS